MRKVTGVYSVVIVMILGLASCTTEDAVLTASSDVSERIDMVMEGSTVEQFFNQSDESDASQDLVRYNYYGNPSNKFDIKLQLDADRTLVFKLVNDAAVNPWELEEYYSIYAESDIEDKLKYVTVELNRGGEVPVYTSNAGAAFPQGTALNVFHIEDFNPAGSEIYCRVVDLPLVSTSDLQETVLLNGTFRGSVTFLD